MRKFLCDVFGFLLDLFKVIIDFVAETLIMIGTAIVDVLSEVSGALGSALLSSPFGFILLGLGAYMLFSLLPDDEGKKKVVVNSVNPAVPQES